MEPNIEKLKKFREKTSNKLESRVKLVVDPDQKYDSKDMHDSTIITDVDNWHLSNESLKSFVQELAENKEMTVEKKILLIHQKICDMYQYDDNAISYFTSIDSIERIFDFPNEYGRVVDESWKQNREKHNRRVCFELSRIYAGALTELLKDEPRL